MLATKIIRRYLSIHNYMKTYEASMVTRNHGRIRVDEYAKLKNSKRMIARLEKEEQNLYQNTAEKWKTHTDRYYQVVRKRLDPRLTSPAQVYDDYQYFTKIHWHNDREYSRLYRRKLSSSSEELILDIMEIPQLKKYFKTVELVKTCFNDSQSIMGFGCDLHNNEKIKWMFKDLNSGRILLENFEYSVKNVVFYDDSSILYIVEDSNKRPCKLYYKKIGSNESKLIYEQKDEQYYMDLHTSKDKKNILITCATKVNTEVLCIEKKSQTQLKLNTLFSRDLKARAFANCSNSITYLWTDMDSSYDYKVVKVNSQTQKKEDFYTPEQGLVIYEVDLFKDFMVLYMRKVSRSVVRILMLNTKESWDLDFPQQVFSALPGANQGYNMREFVFFVNTPFKYNTGYKYNIDKRQLTQLDYSKLTGPVFDEKLYKAHLVQAQSETGDLIPITILQSKDRKGPAKLLLHVYGCYGLQNEVHYNNVYLRALEMGWVIAYAHVRGGGEKGRNWWRQGILQNKSRSWKDLNECVAYLLKQQYTHPALLVLHGGSAGAIAVWNAINHSPWLYKAAIFSYPFLDVLTSLLDESLPLTISDHAEFGNPSDSIKHYNAIQSYCPYQTVKTQEYPAIYIQAGKNDYRCPLYQVMKFSQRFRTRAMTPTKYAEFAAKGLVIDIQKDSSHHGIADQHQSLRKNCQIFGFLDYLLTEINKEVTQT